MIKSFCCSQESDAWGRRLGEKARRLCSPLCPRRISEPPENWKIILVDIPSTMLVCPSRGRLLIILYYYSFRAFYDFLAIVERWQEVREKGPQPGWTLCFMVGVLTPNPEAAPQRMIDNDFLYPPRPFFLLCHQGRLSWRMQKTSIVVG